MAFDNKALKQAFFADLMIANGLEPADVNSMPYEYMESLGFNTKTVLGQMYKRFDILLGEVKFNCPEEHPNEKLEELLEELQEFAKPMVQHTHVRYIYTHWKWEADLLSKEWGLLDDYFTGDNEIKEVFKKYDTYDSVRFLFQAIPYLERFDDEEYPAVKTIIPALKAYSLWGAKVDALFASTEDTDFKDPEEKNTDA